MNKILIYTEITHRRLAYVVHFIQQFDTNHEWVFTSSLNEYQSFEGICMNYSQNRIKEQEVFIKYSGWLIADRKDYLNIPVSNSGEFFTIFPGLDDIGFDIFAALFYLLARVEEYLPFEADAHGRFPANQSILYKNKILAIPITDIWIIQLFNLLESKSGVKLKITKCEPSWSVGIDIDHFFKYKHKSLVKITGGLIKTFFTGKFKECVSRFQVIFLNRKDPYDSYHQIKQLNINKEQLVFFILSGGKSNYDKNHSLHSNVIQEILKKLNRYSTIGLHPSYSSTIELDAIRSEKKNLETCLGTSIEMSRQHYLKIRFPDYYRHLSEAGIKKDYSLGYADYPGFRAGTCKPFYWYDLECEVETDLLLIPFIAMDRTYLDYLKYGPEASETAIKKLFESCMKVGGHFHLIWHNSSYDFDGEWKGWNGVLESLIQYFKMNDTHSV